MIWKRRRKAERPAARNDRDLVQGIGVLRQQLQHRVASLVPGGRLALLLRIARTLAFAPPKDLVARFLQRFLVDCLKFFPGRQKRRLVEEVREIRARASRRAASDALEINPLGEFDLLPVKGEDLLAPLEGR